MEESLFKVDAVNEEDPERDRATHGQVPLHGTTPIGPVWTAVENSLRGRPSALGSVPLEAGWSCGQDHPKSTLIHAAAQGRGGEPTGGTARGRRGGSQVMALPGPDGRDLPPQAGACVVARPRIFARRGRVGDYARAGRGGRAPSRHAGARSGRRRGTALARSGWAACAASTARVRGHAAENSAS